MPYQVHRTGTPERRLVASGSYLVYRTWGASSAYLNIYIYIYIYIYNVYHRPETYCLFATITVT